MLTQITPKSAVYAKCEKCDFICSKKSDWSRHILTRKHKNVDNVDKNVDKKAHFTPKHYTCECGKSYNHRQSLSFHRKNCIIKEENNIRYDTIDINTITNNNSNSSNMNNNIHNNSTINLSEKELILSLLNQNNQLQNQIVEMSKERTSTYINNGSINSNNKTFNLNVFLNEECKNAMNIMDFVDSLKLQLSDLESVGKLGFVEGISNIILKNLKALDVTQRPVHCSDTKREVLYVKDEDKWEKENQERKRLKKAIKHIAHKNSKMLQEFKNTYPDCIYSDSKKSDQYNKIIVESMGGSGKDDDNENKIIKKISKEVIISKDVLVKET
jgi:hypothetical protein